MRTLVSPGTHVSPGALAAGALALVLSGSSWGAEIDARSSTFFGGTPSVVDQKLRTVAPLTELVGLSVRNIETKFADDLSFSIDGWASAEFGGDKVLGGDLMLASVEGRFFSRHLRARLGRQFIAGGTARALFIDGLLLEGRFPQGFGLMAFAGQPVAPAFSNYFAGDFAFGARAFWAPSINVEVGASFTEVLARSELGRQDVGLDGRWRLNRAITLTGSAALSLAEMRLAEVDIGPRWQPIEDLEVRAVYRRTAPDLFLSRTSIFAVFAETSRDEGGATVYYQATKRLGLSADGRAIFIGAGLGYDANLTAMYRPFRSPNTSGTLTVRRLQIPYNAFTEARIGARHKLQSGLALSLDFDLYTLDKPINGQTMSLSGSGTLSWAFSPSWMAAATVWAGTTPLYVSRYEAVAKLIYTFDTRL